MTAPPELPRPPEPLMTVHIASAPGRKARPVTVDAAACTRLLRDVGIAAEGIRQAQAAIDAITGPAGRHAAGILAGLADDDGWTGPITAWQGRRDQPSCPSAWTPDGGPTFACTLVPGHEAVHESWKHGATFPQAAWTDEDADQRGDHPYPPVGDAEAAAVPAVDDDMGDDEPGPFVLSFTPTAEAAAEAEAAIAAAKADRKAYFQRHEGVPYPAHLPLPVSRESLLSMQDDPDAPGLTCAKCKSAPALDDDVICAACEAIEALVRVHERSAR